MSDLFKCVKCGKQLYNKHEQDAHEKDCKGASISMDIITMLATGGLDALHIANKVGFTCAICGDIQTIDSIDEWRLQPLRDVCDNCKSDLKEILLTKRKKDGKA